MKDTTVKGYYKFLREMEIMKKEQLKVTMVLILGNLIGELSEMGWEKKNKGGITDTMVNSEVFKVDFEKNYGDRNVVLTVRIDLKEKYNNDGYRDLTVKGSNTITERGWWKQGTGCSFDFEDSNRGFVLQRQLEQIDQYNS